MSTTNRNWPNIDVIIKLNMIHVINTRLWLNSIHIWWQLSMIVCIINCLDFVMFDIEWWFSRISSESIVKIRTFVCNCSCRINSRLNNRWEHHLENKNISNESNNYFREMIDDFDIVAPNQCRIHEVKDFNPSKTVERQRPNQLTNRWRNQNRWRNDHEFRRDKLGTTIDMSAK